MKKRKWTEQDLKKTALRVKSIRQLLKQLGLKESGGNYKQIKKYLDYYKVNIAHFKGRAWNKGLRGIGKPIVPLAKILVRNSNYQSYKLKKRLFKEKLKKEECENCSWRDKTLDGRIPVEIHHINGNSRDNRIGNLRILCPNCHSLQNNHRGRNIRPVAK